MGLKRNARNPSIRARASIGGSGGFAENRKAPRVDLGTKNSFVEEGRCRIRRLRRSSLVEFIPWAASSQAPEGLSSASPVNRDPLALARFYRGLLDTGVVENRAGLARYLGVSRARVTQVLRRLKVPGNTAPEEGGQ